MSNTNTLFCLTFFALYNESKNHSECNSFQEYINQAVFITYDKNSLLFRLVAMNIYVKQLLRGVP